SSIGHASRGRCRFDELKALSRSKGCCDAIDCSCTIAEPAPATLALATGEYLTLRNDEEPS
ncbi:MAG: hypothetical protein WCD54_23300, partial [Pseudolabrys sp.]